MIFAIPTDTCFWFATSLYDEAWFNLIYRLKWRMSDKRLSFVVKDFDDLKSIIDINSEQIDFLRNYPYPFTVLWGKINSFELPEFLSVTDYAKIAIRVAERCLNPMLHDELVFPMFLTSANESWAPEIYSSIELESKFWNEKRIKIFEGTLKSCPPSDIFGFSWSTLEPLFIRKNH